MEATLVGKWLNLGSEVSRMTAGKADTIKRHTGGDLITINPKYGMPADHANTALNIFPINDWPRFDASEDLESIMKRVAILPFPAHIVQRENPHIDRDMLRESAYIYNFAIQGLLQFIKNGNTFSYCKIADDELQQFAGKASSFQAFAVRHLREQQGSTITTAEISDRYKHYCETHGVVMEAENQWSQWLKSRYPNKHTRCSKFAYDGKTNLRGFNDLALFFHDEDFDQV